METAITYEKYIYENFLLFYYLFYYLIKYYIRNMFLGVNPKEINTGEKPRSIQFGKCLSNTAVRFVVGSNASIMLVGKAKW